MPHRLPVERTVDHPEGKLHIKWGGFNPDEARMLRELQLGFHTRPLSGGRVPVMAHAWPHTVTSMEERPHNWVLARLDGKPVHSVFADASISQDLLLDKPYTEEGYHQRGIGLTVAKHLPEMHMERPGASMVRRIEISPPIAADRGGSGEMFIGSLRRHFEPLGIPVKLTGER